VDFELNDEQRLLRESLTRLLSDRYGFEQRKAYAKEPEGWSRTMWAAYAELGLLGLPFAENEGGFGGGAVETMLVAEALGEALTLEPWFATVVLGGGFLRHGATAERRAELVLRIAQGSLLLALAQTEPQSRWDLHDVATTATRDGDGWVLEGRKVVVLHGDVADKLVVTARTGGDRRDRTGIGVFLVDAKAAGLTRRGHRTNDGRRAAEVTLSGVRVTAEDVLGDPANGLPLIERVAEEAIAALAAEAVGVMAAAQRMTLDYLKVRKQFGVPIGSFQVLQHKAADIMMAIEQSRSMAMYAAMALEEPDPAERARAMSAVKAQIGRAAKVVAEETVQMHGGIGITMEYAVAHCMARLGAIEAMFGNAEFHLRRLADTGGLIAA
jgi:pimeloyl-CoA dehydrogenase small subunit